MLPLTVKVFKCNYPCRTPILRARASAPGGPRSAIRWPWGHRPPPELHAVGSCFNRQNGRGRARVLGMESTCRPVICLVAGEDVHGC